MIIVAYSLEASRNTISLSTMRMAFPSNRSNSRLQESKNSGQPDTTRVPDMY